MNDSTQTASQKSDGWQRRATFRFYEELNDFLPPDRRKVAFDYAFNGTPSVKDSIEAIGVPHPEVDLILVDDVSVGFDHLLNGGERVAVYPMFERVDISSLTRLRPNPLREPRFVLDVHLGKLARYLRLLGFDAIYDRDYDDATIATISRTERRLLLTRDKGLLKRNEVTRGYWLRNIQPRLQIAEVVEAFDLHRAVRVFSRAWPATIPWTSSPRLLFVMRFRRACAAGSSKCLGAGIVTGCTGPAVITTGWSIW